MNQRPIHLLVPMSGQGTRYQNVGYREPKPLIPVSGAPMIARLLEVFPAHWRSHFVMAENHRDTALPAKLSELRPGSELSYIPVHTEGPGLAILRGLDAIPNEDPVFVSYCDYGMVWDSSQFEAFVRSTDCDACLVSYRGFHPHYLTSTTYAYSRLNGDRVVEVREKGNFTSNREEEFASCGGYYFKSAALLRRAVEFQMERGLKMNGEYYTSLTIQALLEMVPLAKVRVFEIPYFFQWGTPNDLQDFEYWESTYRAYNRFSDSPIRCEQVLMPMAGLGTRFAQITSTPKPWIPVNGVPMFLAALKTLPQADRTALVILERMTGFLRDHLDTLKDLHVIPLAQTPPGQAISTEAGLQAVDLDRSVLVSSCDHGVVVNPDRWHRFQDQNDCDAAIFTIRGFPGTRRRPSAFAYVRHQSDSEFPEVADVSVKVPISETPSCDSLLVGTFWFKSGKLLRDGITELRAQDIRANGEIYLDSIFQIFKDNGLKVRVFPLDGYLCWGDPDSLAEALYWREVFCGQRLEIRTKFPGIDHA